MKESDEQVMKRVLRLARLGMGRVSPNPLVGAILIRNGKMVGSGFHQRAGTPHAEIHAIEQAGKRARGSVLYLNLEPCCHTDKKTPPCTESILKSGIKKVVVAMRDPNPKVNGKGLRLLRKRGVEIKEGVLKDEAEVLNEIFICYIRTALPFVALKVAATLDGKIANNTGLSKWITSEKSRQFGHFLRSQYDAILVGKGTVLTDNPELTARLNSGFKKNPVRIIVDEDLSLPLASKVFHVRRGDRVIVATTKSGKKKRVLELEQKGVTVLRTASRQGVVDLSSLLRKLGKMELSSVLIEGGSGINGSVIREKLVDKIYYLTAFKLMGGSDSVSAIGGKSPSSLSGLSFLKRVKMKGLGGDLLIEGYLK